MTNSAAQSERGNGAPLRVLAVCTGNICRSPFLEERLAASLTEPTKPYIETASAGLQAAFEFGRCDELPKALDLVGDADRSPTQVDAELLADFDLILALTTDHRAELLKISPASRSRLFTLIEAANVANMIVTEGHALDVALTGPSAGLDEHDPLRSVPPLPDEVSERLTWLTGEMDAWRGVGQADSDAEVDELRPKAAEGEADDVLSVPDPHLSARDIHPQTASMIDKAAKRLAAAFDSVVEAETGR